MVVLEELEHARARGAVIYGEVAGYASTADAFRITDSHDEGRGAVAACGGARRRRPRARRRRLHQRPRHEHQGQRLGRDAGDQARAWATARSQVPVSSTKSMMGHLIAAGGAVEAIICLLAIRDGVLPPTINSSTPTRSATSTTSPTSAREQPIDVALSNSFGFGGQNTALVIRRFAG